MCLDREDKGYLFPCEWAARVEVMYLRSSRLQWAFMFWQLIHAPIMKSQKLGEVG